MQSCCTFHINAHHMFCFRRGTEASHVVIVFGMVSNTWQYKELSKKPIYSKWTVIKNGSRVLKCALAVYRYVKKKKLLNGWFLSLLHTGPFVVQDEDIERKTHCSTVQRLEHVVRESQSPPTTHTRSESPNYWALPPVSTYQEHYINALLPSNQCLISNIPCWLTWPSYLLSTV